MSERVWLDYLGDIKHSVSLILEFSAGMSFADFEKDDKTQFAVIRCFEIIGEATKRLPDDLVQSAPHIPWKIMAGMRDRLIHGYDSINIPLIWRTILNDIPVLKSDIEKLFEQSMSDEQGTRNARK
jgi:uncharacterized protein with HEPN domain